MKHVAPLLFIHSLMGAGCKKECHDHKSGHNCPKCSDCSQKGHHHGMGHKAHHGHHRGMGHKTDHEHRHGMGHNEHHGHHHVMGHKAHKEHKHHHTDKKPCTKHAAKDHDHGHDHAKAEGHHHGAHAEHQPLAMPCINKSVQKMSGPNAFTAEQKKTWSGMHDQAHKSGMDDLAKKIFALQKKIAISLVKDTWKEKTLKEQLKKLTALQSQAFLIKANMVRKLNGLIKKPEQKKAYQEFLLKRVEHIYKEAGHHH